MNLIKYEFPFAMPPKERERAKGTIKFGKVSAYVYSPSSTKKFYEKIRTYIQQHYPDYEQQKVDVDCAIELIIGVCPLNADNDLDNRIKMIDSLNKDASKTKDPSKFKGIWKDDKLIKKIQAEIVYVDTPFDEFTELVITPFTPSTR